MTRPQIPFKTEIVTPLFRLSYPHIWEPRVNQLNKRLQFEIQMMFPKDKKADLDAMVALAKKLQIHTFGSEQNIKQPSFKDGDKLIDKNPAFKGMILLNAWSKFAPVIKGPDGKTNIDPLQKDEVYGGCWCKALLNCYAYLQPNKGVTFGLMAIQKVRDGEKLGNRKNIDDAFAPVEGVESLAEETSAVDSMFS